MKLNRKAQYGILLTLYLSRSGRASLTDIVETLKVSRPFLEQISNILKDKGLIKSTRGRHGGYELAGDISVKEVLDVLSPAVILDQDEFTGYSRGATEHRALAQYALDINSALHNILRRKIRNIGLQSIANEVAAMNKVNPLSTAIN